MSTHTDRIAAERRPAPSHDGPLPEPEWGLSAPQVAFAVLAIIAACEIIGVLS